MKKLYSNMKIVTFDIETSPLKVYSWVPYGKSWRAIKIIEDWYILSFAAKWLGKKTEVFALPDFKGYKPGSNNDKKLMEEMWKILDECDIVIGHNSKAFDTKKVNARFLHHNMPVPSPYRQIDTLSEARKIAKFTSNKLDDLGEELGIGRKVGHEGFELWEKCMAGVESAWATMKRYNIQDVVLTEKLYLFLRPWMTTHPNVNTEGRSHEQCPSCGSEKAQKRGFSYSGRARTIKKQRYSCINCQSWYQGGIIK